MFKLMVEPVTHTPEEKCVQLQQMKIDCQESTMDNSATCCCQARKGKGLIGWLGTRKDPRFLARLPEGDRLVETQLDKSHQWIEFIMCVDEVM